jgi:aminomethyltransferase
MKKLALDSLHRSFGAKMGEFAGFDMPIQYPLGLKSEHLHTRASAGLFDVSHMGQLRVTAKDGSVKTLQTALERVFPIDFDGWPKGLQKYSYILNAQAGIEDDVMLTFCGDHVRLVVNAGNRSHDYALLTAGAPELDFEWIDAALLALQGPMSEAVLSKLDASCAAMTFMQGLSLQLLGVECFATRSGYTGEDGFEISIPSAQAEPIAKALLDDARVKLVGLGARDTLRLEAGLPLHGNDISNSTHPIEAGLAFAIPKSRRPGGSKAGGFPGSDVLTKVWSGAQPNTRKLVGLIGNENIPIRSHCPIESADGVAVGEVTSGTVSPTLGRPVMLAYVALAALSSVSNSPNSVRLQAVVRDKRPAVSQIALPFVPKQYKR